MPKDQPFELHSAAFDEWFSEHPQIFKAELSAVGSFLRPGAHGVEVGVGTGRFASELGIGVGVEPSASMGQVARSRGVDVVKGTAEDLPFGDGEFDVVLMVTTICFVDDLGRAFREARRVLKESGSIVVAFIDADSPLGKGYQARKADSVFYADATSYTAREVTPRLGEAGFTGFEYRQTVFGSEDAPYPVLAGLGAGGFVVIRARAVIGADADVRES